MHATVNGLAGVPQALAVSCAVIHGLLFSAFLLLQQKLSFSKKAQMCTLVGEKCSNRKVKLQISYATVKGAF